MGMPRTDSPVSLSIVASFLQFLQSVEPASGTDTEGIEVAAQCLSEVFGLSSSQRDPRIRLLPLVDIFTAAGTGPSAGSAPVSSIPSADRVPPSTPVGVLSSSHFSPSTGSSARETPVNECSTMSRESLIEQFREGLDLAGFFEGTMQGTPEYEDKLNQAKQTLDDASKKVRSAPASKWSASYSEDTLVLAEAFKTQGNATMTTQKYQDAIQLYTLAISLCSNNAIFYSNRAAALTHAGKFTEAIADCEVAIKLDPQYSKAYSRLGLVYFAQGRLQEAIEKGFKKALELDPVNTAAQENLEKAQQKLEEQQRGRAEGQAHGPETQTSGTFTATTGPMSMPLPPEIANLLPGILNLAARFGQRVHAAQAYGQSPPQGQVPPQAQGQAQPGSNEGSDTGNDPVSEVNFGTGRVQMDPEVTLDGNFNVTFDGQQLPAQDAGLMQSVFHQMFGQSPGQNPNNTHPSPPGGN